LVLSALTALLVAASALAQDDKPGRIVSMNVCTDQLLLLLVEPERIAAVSWLATDRETSALADRADGLPVTWGVAEEVIARDPDLVLAGTYTTRATVQLLRRLDYQVVEFAPESSFDDIRANLRLMGEAVGEPERADALVAAFDRDLAALRSNVAGQSRQVFANYGVSGWTAGAGSLHADVAHAAGYDTLGERLGAVGSRTLSLEQLIVSSPDLIAVVDRTEGAPALATQALDHPALRHLLASRPSVDVPDPLWVCGGPFTLDAARLLADARPLGVE
jgi:iron complex transport system substrate-binding protein